MLTGLRAGGLLRHLVEGLAASTLVLLVHIHLGGEGRRIVGIDFPPVAQDGRTADNEDDEDEEGGAHKDEEQVLLHEVHHVAQEGGAIQGGWGL